jgi:hypothetical protein
MGWAHLLFVPNILFDAPRPEILLRRPHRVIPGWGLPKNHLGGVREGWKEECTCVLAWSVCAFLVKCVERSTVGQSLLYGGIDCPVEML